MELGKILRGQYRGYREGGGGIVNLMIDLFSFKSKFMELIPHIVILHFYFEGGKCPL